MARKPLLTLRVDDETKARWQAQADAAGLSLSELIRERMDGHAARPRPNGGRPADPPVAPRAGPMHGAKVFKGPDEKPSARKR